MKNQILATRVGHYINTSVRMLTRGLGISISEYLRRLILQDLDTRNIFQNELQDAVTQSESTHNHKINKEEVNA